MPLRSYGIDDAARVSGQEAGSVLNWGSGFVVLPAGFTGLGLPVFLKFI